MEHLRKIWREEQAGKLEANLEKLRALTETGFVQSRYRVADIV